MDGTGKRLVLITVAIVTVASAGQATAAVRYASPTGSGTACTKAAPCKLRAAVSAPAVRSGDQVVVLSGTHRLGATALEVAKGIRVQGATGSPRPKVTSADPRHTLRVVHPKAVVSDLEIVNTTIDAAAADVNGGILQRTFAHANRTGCSLSPDRETRIPLLRDSFCWGSAATFGYGLQFVAVGSTTMALRARMRNVSAVGSGFGVYAFGYGPITLDLDAVNVIAFGTANDPGAGLVDVRAGAASGARVRVVLRNSNYDTRFFETSTGGTAAITPPGSGANQAAVPVFRDPTIGDLHQRRTSPTIDGGTHTLLNGPRDIDRQGRSLGPAPDIGGDEIRPAP